MNYSPALVLTVALGTLQFCVPGSCQESSDDDVFRSHVRTTEALSPADELAALKVPDGFSVTLFASEPQIQKPLNMAFDADGRLWVSSSSEYPMPAKDGAGKDRITVLEDTDGDGTADQSHVFADNLNIPIGLYPWKDGVVVFTIPEIVFLRDTNDDGKADTREVLFGPFDTSRDTHGMNNAFRRGFDGWLYCCHGFNNQSKVKGTDGHQVEMNSGNTYRIRLDGSRIEHFTYGQVNPFGMTIDANGDLFTSDCHTKPVTLLLRDGYYESFGKPHDGLGFVPGVMNHLHGSTAIDAICQYQGTAFPESYRDDLFVGNVMTCRVHRNSIVRNGASIRMQEEEDFLVSEDPWFRPVDIQTGPDGGLYVADFYNRVIGHYEVPLDHPGRDRRRGRIWRIAYTGTSAGEALPVPKLSVADTGSLISSLSDPRKPVRQLVADEIVDRIGAPAIPRLTTALTTKLASGQDHTPVPQLLWCLQRLGGLSVSQLESALQSGEQRVQIHVMRICSERTDSTSVEPLIRTGFRDGAPQVQRAAADAASRHLSTLMLKEVINASALCPDSDVHLKHGLKIALRNQLRDDNVVEWFTNTVPPEVAAQAVAAVLPGLRSENAGSLAILLLKHGRFTASQQADVIRHAARYGTAESLNSLVRFAAALPASEIRLRTESWSALADALAARKAEPPAEFRRWSDQLSEEVFGAVDVDAVFWGQYSIDGKSPVAWKAEQRLAFPDAPRNHTFPEQSGLAVSEVWGQFDRVRL